MYSNISMSSNKETIVTSALEIIDSQEGQIKAQTGAIQELREEKQVLLSLAGILFVIQLLF